MCWYLVAQWSLIIQIFHRGKRIQDHQTNISYGSNPAFWDKTINLISRHLNLFTSISQQVLLSFYHQQRYALEMFAALGSNGKKCDRNQRHKLPKKIWWGCQSLSFLLHVVFCTPLDLSNKGKNEARNLARNEPNHSNQWDWTLRFFHYVNIEV